jgi:hypothetical protein
LPKAVRNHIALGVASGFTGVLVLLWFVSVSSSVAPLGTSAAVIESQAGVFSTFRDGLSNQLDGVRSIGEVWQEAAAELQSFPETSVVDESGSVTPAEESTAVSPVERAVTPVTIESGGDMTVSAPVDDVSTPVPVRIATTSRVLPAVTDVIE